MLIGERSVEKLENQKKFPCPCCGSPNQITEEGCYEWCNICGWQDDGVQRDYPDDTGANCDWTLKEARKHWASGGTIFASHPNPNSREK